MSHLPRNLIITFFLTCALFLIFISVGVKREHISVVASSTSASSTTLTDGTTTIMVDVVDTPESRERGLSGKMSLSEDRGMLFIFDKAEAMGFWMPDMHFAIDIIWIDEHHRIVSIKENATPESYPEVFKPSAPARYVLEVPSGMTKKWGWKDGIILNFTTAK